MTDSRDAAGRGRSPLWMRLALVVSVGLNLLVAGLVVGAGIALRGDPERLRPFAASERGAAPFVQALAPEDRRGAVRELVGERGELRAIRRDFRASMDDILAALRADPFDADEFRALLRAQRDVVARRQGIGEDVLLRVLQEMTPAERAAYADRLGQSLAPGLRR